MLEWIGVAVFGVLWGMRHALEPDHLAAVSTIAVEQRSATAGLRVGATWGLGHTISLFVVGALLAAAGRAMPATVADVLEGCVAVMIVLLGFRALLRARDLGRAGPTHRHAHAGHEHIHAAGEPHVHLGAQTLAVRPLLVGLLHGLAGSGALTALVVARIPTTAGRLAYIALFGFGSILGMAALTGVAGLPMARLGRSSLVSKVLLTASGAIAVLVGGWWGLESVARLVVR